MLVRRSMIALALAGLALAVVAGLDAALGWTLIGFVIPGVVAIIGSWGDAENILHGQCDAASGVILKLGHAHEEISLFVRLVQIESREDGASTRNFEALVSFAGSQGVGVFENDIRGNGFELPDVPTGIQHVLFERARGGPGAFYETNPFCSGLR